MALADPGFPEVGAERAEMAGLGHRECAGRVFNAPKRVLGLGQAGGYQWIEVQGLEGCEEGLRTPDSQRLEQKGRKWLGGLGHTACFFSEIL